MNPLKALFHQSAEHQYINQHQPAKSRVTGVRRKNNRKTTRARWYQYFTTIDFASNTKTTKVVKHSR